jgi:hypothetical protein
MKVIVGQRSSIVVLVIIYAASAGWLSLKAQGKSAKKGIGEYGQPFASHTLLDARVAWYYDWRPTTDVSSPPRGIQFIPMIWGGKNLNTADETAAEKTGAGTLLTFNEPDNGGQSNMTVAQALTAWPELEALDMKLGSPAMAGDATNPNGWLAQFMAGAKAKGYRVDFICIHSYQKDFNADSATKKLVSYLTAVHEMYGLPIWLTQYAMGDWPAGVGITPDYKTQASFAQESAPALESLPFVERYAWFVDAPNQPTWSAYNPDGSPTAVGAAWRTAP